MKDKEYLQLYGSFVNGKADLRSSDIDIHLSDKITEQALKYIGEWGFASSKKTHKLAQSAFNRLFQSVEQETLKVMGRDLKDDLFEIKPEPVGNDNNFGKVQNLGLYNPVLLKIYKDRLVLQLVDVYIFLGHKHAPEIVEVEIE